MSRYTLNTGGLCQRLAVCASVALIPTATHAVTILHVDADAPAGGTGLTWSNAYQFLRDALADAAAAGGAVNEIRVAQGVYLPDRNEANPQGAGGCFVADGGVGCSDPVCEAAVCGTLAICCAIEWDLACVSIALDMCGDARAKTFQLVNNVGLRGGYAGLGAADPDVRNIELYETTLSGDLAGNDDPDPMGSGFLGYDENSYNVVTASGTDDSALLDGFTITGGNADGPDDGELNWIRGGGIWSLAGSPTVTDCTIAYNYARQAGGGIYNRQNSSPTISDCTIEGNVAANGLGGGMVNAFDSSPTVIGCDFIANSSSEGGGGMISGFNSLPTIVTDCTFVDNVVDQTNFPSAGGGMGCLEADAIVSRCSLTGNTAREGGGMVFEESTPTITDCQFLGNAAAFGGAIELFSNSNATLVNCVMAGNAVAVGGDGLGGLGGGVYTHTSQP
ncbi:MAG: right-handed parallel beta-helix repeat-containing protein, partial [Planctomycetota bacterium]